MGICNALDCRVALPLALPLLLLGGCAVTGGLSGGLTAVDRQQMADLTQSALESTRTGESVNWRGSEGDILGTVTPIRTYYQANGQPCRDFQRSLTVKGATEVDFATACRQPSGGWRIGERNYAYRDGRYQADRYRDPYWDDHYYHGYPYRYRPGFGFGYGHGHSHSHFGYGQSLYW